MWAGKQTLERHSLSYLSSGVFIVCFIAFQDRPSPIFVHTSWYSDRFADARSTRAEAASHR